MTHDKEEYLLIWKNIHNILWNHGSYTRVWLLVVFFFLSLYEYIGKRKTNKNRRIGIPNVNSESLKSVITSYLFFTMLFQITKIFLNESNFYFENKCNKKENNFL